MGPLFIAMLSVRGPMEGIIALFRWIARYQKAVPPTAIQAIYAVSTNLTEWPIHDMDRMKKPMLMSKKKRPHCFFFHLNMEQLGPLLAWFGDGETRKRSVRACDLLSCKGRGAF